MKFITIKDIDKFEYIFSKLLILIGKKILRSYPCGTTTGCHRAYEKSHAPKPFEPALVCMDLGFGLLP